MSDDNIDGVFGGTVGDEPKEDAPKPAAKKPAAKKAGGKAQVKRIRIILAKNDDVPPSGLFIGHNGVGYQLKAGKPADVPEFLLDVLDNAVVKKPIVGDNGRIIGHEDSPRFPYQVVRDKR